ncbi:MAG: tetratricopeptide repeat protein [Candidatus Latescibacterota bacterium]
MSQGLRVTLQAGLVVLAGVLAHGNTLDGSFHYDDFHSLVDNRGIRSLGHIPAFFVDPSLFSRDADKAMYRPLLLVSYALNYAAGGYRLLGYHLVNLGLHLGCSLLVWGAARQLVGRGAPALLSGLLFAVHPLAGEPVHYISARSESLAALFVFLALLLHLHARGRPLLGRWSLAACGAGLLAKSTGITAPVLLWLQERWSGQRRPWRAWVPHALLVGGYLAVVCANAFLPRSLAAPARPWDVHLWTQAKAPAYYLKLLVLPIGLNVEHQFAESASPAEPAVLAGLALVASLAWLAWRGAGGWPLTFCLVWGGIVLLPSTLMPLNMLVNERRLYLVLAAFAWACGLLARRRAGWLLASLVPLGILAAARGPVWQSELSLWREAVRRAPGMYRVQANLGKALQLAGDTTGARLAYQRAIALDPRRADAHNNLATLQHEAARRAPATQRQALLGEAVAGYRRALERAPRSAEIAQNLADACAQQGEVEEAAALYERALRTAPQDGALWSNYGQTLYEARRWAEAEEAWRRAMALLPERPEPANNLANLMGRLGRHAEAVDLYRQALARQPEERATVLANLADTYRELGELELAREALTEAGALDPVLPQVPLQLGRVERTGGDLGAAAAAFARACQLDSGLVSARLEWGEVLLEMGQAAGAAEAFGAAVDLDPANPRAWYGLGRARQAQDQAAGALEAYGRFLQTWPHRDGRRQEVEERCRRLRREG